ncbi:small nuclear ribonucleoprotein G [Tremella mesenterica]|uniref:Sm protein G n=1 Tax=Tremella mesenterica TaxID=5217 RepID=A0A4Q1BI93_TREME|nr:small nuclear ribonucleoprotein G [Tremella mesenterica]
MSRASQPELKKFMDRKLYLHLQGGRAVSGILRGYDMFLNLVVDNAFEELGGGKRQLIGTTVS